MISDTHFGDDTCKLVRSSGYRVILGEKYQAFKDAAGKDNDYLILVGDIFDFSITSYENAYRYGQVFFQAVRDDGVAKEIIYVAGNHDADIWHIIQHQRAVINRFQRGELPESFEHSVAGIIDDRSMTAPEERGFSLDKIRVRAGPGRPKYGGMFLDGITAPPTVFNFAYPNLYVATDNETVLVTHGQYLEPYWALLGEWVMKLAQDDLTVGELNIEKMVEMNFPLNQLGCTGVGQAGALTNWIRQVQTDVNRGDLKRVKKYLNRLEKEIDDLTDYRWLKEWVVDYLVGRVKEGTLEVISSIPQTRFNDEFIYKKEVKERFKRFYCSSFLEIADINARTGLNIPAPRRIIFGHTHQPIPWDDPNPPILDDLPFVSPNRPILSNTGGWLAENDRFCGAEVFLYETGKGFSSVSI